MSRLFVFTLAVGLSLAVGGDGVAQPKEPPGYWKFVEAVRVEYPIEMVHKLYPVAFEFEGSKLTAVAKALDGNNPKVIHTEEHQVWTWTAPPQILVPGEKIPMTFELKLERPKFDKVPGVYIGGSLDAGFAPPKPTGSAVYHRGGDTRTEKGERGVLWPGAGGKTFEPGTYTKESTVAVPGRNNPWMVKEHPGQISFRVGGGVGNTRQFNTIYEYKWVEGVAPADRGGPAGDKSKDKSPGANVGRWEYRVLNLPLDQALGERLEGRLTELGNDGWELAGVILPPAAAGPQAAVRLVLKRPRR
ncbi:hypothetical protein [Urbifossiella limnaea]|uniref:DUF4177 domain-containing protein n=1 Tax=Urbifossiella limnaea TaxID=2528023 RepID=A0A517Y315_9BACT|nr:hypothetical protein [Urbifossiella limnaea]QDU24129.1 hypothetical protein ETAA1_61430 [Urbifossiella limnaea]